MMHNSLQIRHLLAAANADPLHRARRDPHRALRVDGSRTAGPDEVLLDGDWRIVATADIPGADEVSADLADFLGRFAVQPGANATRQIRFVDDSALDDRAFQVQIEPGDGEVRARTPAGLWAALVQIEREMARRRAPILPRTTLRGTPTWPTQISQAPYGSNYLVPDLSPEYLSDDAFRLLAHYGVNGMTLYGDWLCYVRSERFPELNSPDYERNIAVLRDAARRAGRYGVRFYYVAVSPKLVAEHPLFTRHPAARGSRIFPGLSPTPKSIHCLCSSDPESLAFHHEVLGNLFKEVPELGGLILIVGVESFYHCYMRPDRRGLPAGTKTNCEACAAYRPEEVVNRLLATTAAGVHAHAPGAAIMAWPYSGYLWSSDPGYLELVRGLPEQVAWLSEIDKDQWTPKDGYEKLTWDYSVDFTGPTDQLVAQAEILAQQDRPLYIKSETALGLEAFHVPYVPSMQRHAQKWANIRRLRPAGVLQSWMFFGMWGSRAEELGWWANWRPERTDDEALAEIAARDFGSHAPRVLKAWEQMSTAVGHLPYIPPYFTGPEFIGPAHPLFFDPHVPLPEIFTSLLYYLQENEETFSTATTEVRQSLVMNAQPHDHLTRSIRVEDGADGWDLAIREYERVVDASRKAFEVLQQADAEPDIGAAANLREELLVVELLYRTWLTTLHSIRWLHLRERLHAEGNLAQMLQIAREELANTRAARHIFVDAPWLDLGQRVDGEFPSSLAMIDAKLEIMEREIERNLTTCLPHRPS